MNNQFNNRIDNISIIQNISYLRSHDTARQTQDTEVMNGQDTKTMTLAVRYRRTQKSFHCPSEGHKGHDTGRQTPKDISVMTLAVRHRRTQKS